MELAEDTDTACGATNVDSACGSELDVTYCCLKATGTAYTAKRSTTGTIQRQIAVPPSNSERFINENMLPDVLKPLS